MWTRTALLSALCASLLCSSCALDETPESTALPPGALSVDAVDLLAVDALDAGDGADAPDLPGTCANTCMWEGPVILTTSAVARDATGVWVTGTLEWRPCCAEPVQQTRVWWIDGRTAESRVVEAVPADAIAVAMPASQTSAVVVEMPPRATRIAVTRQIADSLWSDLLPVARWRDPRTGDSATVRVEVRRVAVGTPVASSRAY